MSQKARPDVKDAIMALLADLGEDVARDGLRDTPARFEKQIRECLVGYTVDPQQYIKLFENTTKFQGLVTVSRISFSSLCEHHLLPFSGYADIAYIPADKILGLSKFARIVDAFSKRLQVQEHLNQEIANFLYEQIKPELLMVRLRASHTCMTIRGVNRPESLTETSVLLGNTAKHQTQVDNFQQMAR